MLKDIAGNLISSLGGGGGAASAPSTIFTPSQILSTGLTIWYDFNDRSVLFTDTAATINVSLTNDIIRYVRNKGTDRNYDLISLFPTQTSVTSSDQVLAFKPNNINTNKNANFVGSTGNTSGAGAGPLGSISATTTSGASQPSAITFSAVFRTHSNTGGLNTIIGGFVANKCVIYVQPNNTTVNFIIVSNTGSLNTITIPIVTGERYHYFTIVIDSNNTYNLTFNNLKYNGTLASNIFPLVPNTTSANGRFYLGYISQLTSAARTQPNSEYLDIVISTNTVLTDDQIIRLHQYYKLKYNLR
jgi:hypothetical protein